MTQKNLLYFVNRFNLLLHHAEMNNSLGMQALMQLVHELKGSIDDLELRMLHPQDAYTHFLLALEAIQCGRSVASEAATWIADHHDAMLDARAIETYWRSSDPELIELPIHQLMQYREKGVVGYFRQLELEMKSLHTAQHRELVSPKFHEELQAAYKQKELRSLLAFYEKAEWVRPYWRAIRQLHDPFSFRVMRMSMR